MASTLTLNVGLDGPEGFELTLGVELGVDHEGAAIRCADAHGEDIVAGGGYLTLQVTRVRVSGSSRLKDAGNLRSVSFFSSFNMTPWMEEALGDLYQGLREEKEPWSQGFPCTWQSN